MQKPELNKRETILDRIYQPDDDLILSVPEVPPLYDAARVEEKKIDIGGGIKLYCDQEGQGVPVVLINGGPGGTHYSFRREFSDAAKQGVAKFIYYDQRGCGLSDAKPGTTGRYSVEQAVGDLDALRQKLGIEKWVVLGHSYGGSLARMYAEKYPEHVLGVVSVCAAGVGLAPAFPRTADVPGGYPYNSQTEKDRWDIIGKKDLGPSVKDAGSIKLYNQLRQGAWAGSWFAKPSENEMAEFARYAWKPGANFSEQMGESVAALDKNAKPGWPKAKLDVPVLQIEGAHDRIWTTDKPEIMWRTLSDRFENVRLKMIEDAAHNPWMDRPSEFFKELKNFVVQVRHGLTANSDMGHEKPHRPQRQQQQAPARTRQAQIAPRFNS